MTLLRVYNNNGHVARKAHDYGFPDLMNDFFGESASGISPKVNISENNESFTLLMAVPGVNKSDINMHIEKNMLTISREEKEEAKVTRDFTRREFDFGSFERNFRLPETVDTEKIEASMENGILKVLLPKKDEAIDKGPREISIS